MIEIFNYNLNYSKQIDDLDEDYWGNSEAGKVSESIKLNDIVKIAIINNEVVGMLHFKIIGDLVDAHHILVSNNYQNQGIGTLLMKSAFKELEDKNIKNIIAHAVEHDWQVNAEKLLKKFGFVENYRVKKYWNSLYPGEYCKQCNNNNFHCCVVVFIKKYE